MNHLDCDFLVIGSGIAGLTFALKCAPFGKVIVVTKAELADTNTSHAQGGMAAAVGEGDSLELHVQVIPRAVDALGATCARTGDCKTDSICRALVVYQVVLDLMERADGQLLFRDAEGRTERIHLL
jgi:aspartate oxidase